MHSLCLAECLHLPELVAQHGTVVGPASGAHSPGAYGVKRHLYRLREEGLAPLARPAAPAFPAARAGCLW